MGQIIRLLLFGGIFLFTVLPFAIISRAWDSQTVNVGGLLLNPAFGISTTLTALKGECDLIQASSCCAERGICGSPGSALRIKAGSPFTKAEAECQLMVSKTLNKLYRVGNINTNLIQLIGSDGENYSCVANGQCNARVLPYTSGTKDLQFTTNVLGRQGDTVIRACFRITANVEGPSNRNWWVDQPASDLKVQKIAKGPYGSDSECSLSVTLENIGDAGWSQIDSNAYGTGGQAVKVSLLKDNSACGEPEVTLREFDPNRRLNQRQSAWSSWPDCTFSGTATFTVTVDSNDVLPELDEVGIGSPNNTLSRSVTCGPTGVSPGTIKVPPEIPGQEQLPPLKEPIQKIPGKPGKKPLPQPDRTEIDKYIAPNDSRQIREKRETLPRGSDKIQ